MPAIVLGPLPSATNATLLPLFSGVSCGFPSPAEPYAEQRLSLDDLVQTRQPSTFLVRAMGDSMIGSGIHPGDVIVVNRAIEPKPGHVIVACVANAFTVKRLRREGGRTILEPDNPEHRPTVLAEDEELLVWGVCTWNLHRL